MSEFLENLSQEEESRLNKPITVKFLLTFTVPTILSFMIMGIFGTIDSVFAARGISNEALAAVNFVAPFFSFAMAISAMLSMGGSALVAKKKGKKLHREARENLSLITLVAFITSAIIAVAGWFARVPLLRLLGARTGYIYAPELGYIYDSSVFELAVEYITPLILMMPFIMVGVVLVQFLIAEGRPVLGMIASSSGAIVSTSLNAIFIFGFDMGVMSLALATGIGYTVPALLGAVYFTFNRKGTLYFVKPKFDIYALGRSSLNGISEMITMMSGTVATTVMNNVLVSIVGWEGVAASGAVFALIWLFMSMFVGYSAGVAPVISYNYGKKLHYGLDSAEGQERRENLKNIYKKSLFIIGAIAAVALVGTLSFSDLLVRIYFSPDDLPMGHMHTMAVRGLRIASTAFVLMGFNIFATGMFTAFNDGLVSGFMSLMRTMVFSLAMMLTLPRIFGLDGVWLAFAFPEVLSIFITIFFLVKMSKKYHYREKGMPELLPKQLFKR